LLPKLVNHKAPSGPVITSVGPSIPYAWTETAPPLLTAVAKGANSVWPVIVSRRLRNATGTSHQRTRIGLQSEDPGTLKSIDTTVKVSHAVVRHCEEAIWMQSARIAEWDGPPGGNESSNTPGDHSVGSRALERIADEPKEDT
jgi:hypothetical protein